MNMYFVIGTELEKKKQVTDVRAVNARDMAHLSELCNQAYVRWSLIDERGPFKLSDNWS